MLKHTATEQAVDQFCRNPSHALILLGGAGTGKRSIGLEITRRLLEIEDLENFPYFLEVQPDELNIETVRRVKSFLSKTTTGSKPIRRIVLMNGADTLNDSGQNALLKSIEEPPHDTVMIMTAVDQTMLLPTITSRSRILHVLPIEMMAVMQEYTSNHSEDTLKRAYTITKGHAASLHDMLASQDQRPELDMAKRVLQSDTFQRLSMVDEITKSKMTVNEILSAMEIAISTNFDKSVSIQQQAPAVKLHGARKQLQFAQKQLAAKVNTKLVLTRLFLSI